MRILSFTVLALATTMGAASAADMQSKLSRYDADAAPNDTARVDATGIEALAPDLLFGGQALNDDAEPDYRGVEAQGDAAYEDEIEAGGWSFSGTAGMVSDYRYRGVSLTDREAAFQADLTIASSDGLYFYGWASQIADNGGDNIELQGSVGWSGAFFTDAITIDAAAGLYAYPGVSDSSMLELSASFTQDVGGVSVTSGISYMPEQSSIAELDNTYLSLTLGSPLPFWEAAGSIGLGWEDGAFGEGKVDWIAAFEVPIESFTLRLAYTGAERHSYGSAGDGAFFAELRYSLGGEA